MIFNSAAFNFFIIFFEYLFQREIQNIAYINIICTFMDLEMEVHFYYID